MDLTGVANLFDKPDETLSLVQRLLYWLFSTPWWVAAGTMLATGAWLMWLTRDRVTTDAAAGPNAIPEAMVVVAPNPDGSPTMSPARATDIATFSLHWTEGASVETTLLINPAKLLSNVVVMVRFALPFHYISESNWRWSVPKRVAEQSDLMEGERLEIPYLSRDKDNDHIWISGRQAPLKWEDPEQGEMVRVEVVVQASEGRASFDRIWTFRRFGERRFIDCLNSERLDYPDDNRVLALVAEVGTGASPSRIADPISEPDYSQNVFEVFHRVQEAWKATPHSPPDAIRPMLYDRLRQGGLKCWGRPSKRYEPSVSQPWPLRVAIPKEFWEANVIEDVEHWMEHRGWRQGSPTNTITMPIKGKRNVALCYWDLVFDPSDARRLWPLKNDWMAN